MTALTLLDNREPVGDETTDWAFVILDGGEGQLMRYTEAFPLLVEATCQGRVVHMIPWFGRKPGDAC